MEQSISASDGACAVQYAAMCWRRQRGNIQVLLITSRDTGRWVIPKGWSMEGRTPAEAAAREAWEEAGVTGAINPVSIGCYRYDKMMPKSRVQPCEVGVFGLRVQKLATEFPERGQRRRKWFSAREASALVNEEGLRQILTALPDLLGDGGLAAGPDRGHTPLA